MISPSHCWCLVCCVLLVSVLPILNLGLCKSAFWISSQSSAVASFFLFLVASNKQTPESSLRSLRTLHFLERKMNNIQPTIKAVVLSGTGGPMLSFCHPGWLSGLLPFLPPGYSAKSSREIPASWAIPFCHSSNALLFVLPVEEPVFKSHTS